MAWEIANISGIPIATNLGKYLGTPSIDGRVKVETYQQILDRMQSKLEKLKTKYLSLIGRNALAQSILAAIPQYTVQSTMVPKMLCNRIDKMIRGFIWGDSEGKGRVHLINWETITRTKDQGDLGIKTLHGMNLAFMAKIGWRL